MQEAPIARDVYSRIYAREELAQIALSQTAAGFGQYYSQLPTHYTQRLIHARGKELAQLKTGIQSQFSHAIEEKMVVEVGPGIQDLLYEMLAPSMPKNWHAIDIHPAIVGALKEQHRSNPHYNVSLGHMGNVPVDAESQDLVIGICALDSIIDFDVIVNEIHRILKPGGLLVHIQDLMPSWTTIQHLVLKDPHLTNNVGFFAYDSSGGGKGGVSHVMFPTTEPMPSNEYLHTRLAHEFSAKLHLVENGVREYATHNMLISTQFSAVHFELGRYDLLNPSYAFLIMKKNGAPTRN
jgi:ubiquinone/menaquinone biosynthesis C-methylase UbiE